jgi:hypothetical protein
VADDLNKTRLDKQQKVYRLPIFCVGKWRRLVDCQSRTFAGLELAERAFTSSVVRTVHRLSRHANNETAAHTQAVYCVLKFLHSSTFAHALQPHTRIQYLTFLLLDNQNKHRCEMCRTHISFSGGVRFEPEPGIKHTSWDHS